MDLPCHVPEDYFHPPSSPFLRMIHDFCLPYIINYDHLVIKWQQFLGLRDYSQDAQKVNKISASKDQTSSSSKHPIFSSHRAPLWIHIPLCLASEFGNENFYALWAVLCQFAFKPEIACQLCIVWGLTLFIGQYIKDLLHLPRPGLQQFNPSSSSYHKKQSTTPATTTTTSTTSTASTAAINTATAEISLAPAAEGEVIAAAAAVTPTLTTSTSSSLAPTVATAPSPPPQSIYRLETQYAAEFGLPSTHSAAIAIPLYTLLVLHRDYLPISLSAITTTHPTLTSTTATTVVSDLLVTSSSAAAVAATGAASSLLLHHNTLLSMISTIMKTIITLFCLFWIICTPLSRLYMGVHSVFDIISGMLIGIFCCLLVYISQFVLNILPFAYTTYFGLCITILITVGMLYVYPKHDKTWTNSSGDTAVVLGSMLGSIIAQTISLSINPPQEYFQTYGLASAAVTSAASRVVDGMVDVAGVAGTAITTAAATAAVASSPASTIALYHHVTNHEPIIYHYVLPPFGYLINWMDYPVHMTYFDILTDSNLWLSVCYGIVLGFIRLLLTVIVIYAIRLSLRAPIFRITRQLMGYAPKYNPVHVQSRDDSQNTHDSSSGSSSSSSSSSSCSSSSSSGSGDASVLSSSSLSQQQQHTLNRHDGTHSQANNDEEHTTTESGLHLRQPYITSYKSLTNKSINSGSGNHDNPDNAGAEPSHNGENQGNNTTTHSNSSSGCSNNNHTSTVEGTGHGLAYKDNNHTNDAPYNNTDNNKKKNDNNTGIRPPKTSTLYKNTLDMSIRDTIILEMVDKFLGYASMGLFAVLLLPYITDWLGLTYYLYIPITL